MFLEDEPDNAIDTFNYIETKAEKLRGEIVKRQPVIAKHKSMAEVKRDQANRNNPDSMNGEDAGQRSSIASKSVSDVSLAESELTDVLAKKQGALKELRILQEAVKKNREELKNFEEESKERRKRYEMDIANLEKKTDQVRIDLEQKSAKLKQAEIKLENKLALNTAKVDSIIKENSELKFELEKLEGEKVDLETEKQSQKDKHAQELKFKSAKIEALNEEIEDLQTQSDELEKEYVAIQENLSMSENEQKTKLSNLETQISKLNQDLDDKKQDLLDSNQKCKEIEKDLKQQIEVLNQTIVEKDRISLSENEKRVANMSQKSSELTRMKQLMTETIQTLKSAKLNDEDSENTSIEFIVHEAKMFKKDHENLNREIESLNLQLKETNNYILKMKEDFKTREQKLKKNADSLSDELRLHNIKSDKNATEFVRREEHLKLELEKSRNEFDLKLQVANDSFAQKESVYESKIEQLNSQIAQIVKENALKVDRVTEQLNTEKIALERDKNEQISQLTTTIKDKSLLDINKFKEDAAKYFQDLQEVSIQLQTAKKSDERSKKELNALEKTVDVELENACKVLSSVLNVSLPVTFPPFGNVSNRIKDILSKLALLRALISELRGFVDTVNRNCEQLKVKIDETEQRTKSELLTAEKAAKQDKNEAITKVRSEIIEEYLTQVEELRGLIEMEKKTTGKIRSQLREKDEQIHNMKISMNDWKTQTMSELQRSMREQIDVEIEVKMQRENLIKREIYSDKERECKRLKDEVAHLNSRIQTLSNINFDNKNSDESDGLSNRLVRQLQKKNRQLQYENMQMRLRDASAEKKLNQSQVSECECNICRKQRCRSSHSGNGKESMRSSGKEGSGYGRCVKRILNEDRKQLAASMSDLTIYGV